MTRTRNWFVRLAVLTLMACAGTAAAEAPSNLEKVAADVAKKWPGLNHIQPVEVEEQLESGNSVIFDVRSPEEYAVSHLPGAILVDPSMSRLAFLAAHGAKLPGKTVVFYCAVGVRSSTLAERIGAEALTKAGAISSVNLTGGIFAWASEEKPLVNADGPTRLVHGYDASWGKLVKGQDRVRAD